jgi:hypothetical protein
MKAETSRGTHGGRIGGSPGGAIPWGHPAKPEGPPARSAHAPNSSPCAKRVPARQRPDATVDWRVNALQAHGLSRVFISTTSYGFQVDTFQ